MKRGPKAPPTATTLPKLRAKTPSGRVAEFFRTYLRHPKGEWQGRPLTLAGWQMATLIRPLYDTLLRDGRRQYRTTLALWPRKNSKSTTAIGLGLYHLVADGEPGAEVALAGTDRANAGLLMADARYMVQADPVLASLITVYRNELVIPTTNSRLRVLSSEAPRAHGLNLSVFIYDELWAAPNRDLWDALTTSMAARRQPLAIAISTAGYDPHTILGELYRHALKVQENPEFDPSFLPSIFAASEDDDWTSPATWAKANPNYTVSVKQDFLEQECRRAQAMPAYENTFKRLHLNLWTESETRWLSMPAWDACGETGAPLPPLSGRRCYLGVDLSSTRDLSALVAIFPDDDGAYDVLCNFWLPNDNMHDRVRRDRVPFDVWAREGYLRLSGGNIIDHDAIERRIRELGEQYMVEAVAIDPWNASQMIARLQADGIPAVPQSQTIGALTSATKALESLVLTGKLRHGGNPILKWCAGNVTVETDHAENLKPSKKKSTERIDGISALVNALAVALPATTGSVYDTRGPLLVEL